MIMPAQEPYDRHAAGDPLAQRLEQLEARRASLLMVVDSPPGITSAVDRVQLVGPADRPGDRAARRPARAQVLADIALQGEDADDHRRRARHQPRSASRCGCGISSTLMPTIASPRPRETLAMHVRVVVEGGGLDDRRGPLRPGCRT